MLFVILACVGNEVATGTELTLGEASVRLVLPPPRTTNLTLFNWRDKVLSSVGAVKTLNMCTWRGRLVEQILSELTCFALQDWCVRLILIKTSGASRAVVNDGSKMSTRLAVQALRQIVVKRG